VKKGQCMREAPWEQQQQQQSAREQQERSRLGVAPSMAEAADAAAAQAGSPGAAEAINIPAHIQVPEDFPSISIAVDMAADGDIILIAPGEYRESINLNKDVTLMGHRGSPQECVLISKNATTITFCARRGKLKNLSLRVEDTSNFFHCLVVENGEVEMEGCQLSGGAWGICINNRASATIRGCHIHDNKGTGVNVYGGARLLLMESEVCANRGRGISVSDSGTSVVLTGNLIHHCSDGVYVYGKANLRMEENYVHSNQDSGVTVHESGTTAVIKRNYMQRNGWGGVRIYSGAGADVQDNDLQGNQSGALAIDKGSQAVVIVDNNQTAEALPTGLNSPSFLKMRQSLAGSRSPLSSLPLNSPS